MSQQRTKAREAASAGATGATWESETIDFTAFDTGSIVGGPAYYATDLGTLVTFTIRNQANCSDVSVDFGVGLTIQGVNGNFETTTPGVDIDPHDVFSDFDPLTDEIALTIEADVAGLPSDHGVFIVCYPSNLTWSNDHASLGVINTSAPRTYYPRRRQTGGTLESGTSTGAAKDFLTFHLKDGQIRACADTTRPADPYAATTIKALWPGASGDGYSTTSPFMSGANLRFSVVAMTTSSGGTVTIRSMTFWRLRKDAG